MPRVLVCISGGVDSSVAAVLLIEAGYDVTGAFMVNYPASPAGYAGQVPASTNAFTGRSVAEPCWRGDYQDALRVAAKLGIKLLRLDFTKEYKKMVLSYMYREYEAGRTPNPDVMCNKFIKFGVWLDKARELGFDYLATGHYARVNCHSERSPKGEVEESLKITCQLLESKDKNKDQTYFLHQLNQKQLKHILFPIGGYTKPEVRKLAKKFNLPTADKEESMGICFIGEVPMKEFLQKKIKPKPGKIINTAGEAIGVHEGLAFYTVGQRVGNLSLRATKGRGNPINIDTKPLYIVDKDIKANKLIVGHENDPLLFKKEITVKEVNWVSGQPPKFPLKCEVRLRHRQPLQKCVCHCEEAEGRRGNLIVNFTTPQRAITPGQFAVFYKKSECCGGGVII